MITSRDTHAEADYTQIKLLRRAGIKRRLELTCSISKTIMDLSRQAIMKRHPELAKREAEIKIVAYF